MGDAHGEQDWRGVGTRNVPPSGPSGLGLACPPTPHPPPVPYAPAVHNDGAGAAPVALVHLPATRNGHEARGHQQRQRGAETHTRGPVFLFSPPAQGRGGKRAGWRSRGWRLRTRDGVGGHWTCLVTMGLGYAPGTTDKSVALIYQIKPDKSDQPIKTFQASVFLHVKGV